MIEDATGVILVMGQPGRRDSDQLDVFDELDVSSRVDVARAVEDSEFAAYPPE